MNATRNNTKTTPTEIRLDADLRAFLLDAMSCQSPGIAAWATKIMRAGRMTMADLERCLILGFEF